MFGQIAEMVEPAGGPPSCSVFLPSFLMMESDKLVRNLRHRYWLHRNAR